MRTIAILVGVVILLAALKAASAIVVPLLLATMIALAFQPISERLARRGVPPIVAAILTILCVLGAIAGVAFLIGLAARDFAADAPRYGAELGAMRDQLKGWLSARGMGAMAGDLDSAAPQVGISDLLSQAAFMLSGVLGTLFNVLLLTAFMQVEATMLRDKLELVLADSKSSEHVSKAMDETQRYFRVKAMLSLANGVLLGTWCAIWGVSNPVLWGVLAFALNFVPIIGSLLAAIPPVVLGLVELGLGGALGVAAGFAAVNVVVDNMLEPRLMGRALGVSPLVLMISLLVWGFVLGPVGALLSVPLTVAVRIFFDNHPQLRWVGLLMASSTRDYKDVIRQGRTPHMIRPPE